MENFKKYFLGANSCESFVSHFGDCYLAEQGYNVYIIKGGPGTGKTTAINFLIKLFEKQGLKIALCAPAGRAAKRMEETTNMHASTIHKALGYNYEGGFSYNENCLLSPSLIIIDEASMLDVNIAASLFKFFPSQKIGRPNFSCNKS